MVWEIFWGILNLCKFFLIRVLCHKHASPLDALLLLLLYFLTATLTEGDFEPGRDLPVVLHFNDFGSGTLESAFR
jgi:hypothetical protein